MTAATSRRAAIGAGLAALTGALAAPVLAKSAAAQSPDANLIALCNRVIAIETEYDAVIATRCTLADEQRTDPDLQRLSDELDHIGDAIEGHLPPHTMEGASALAQAAEADMHTGCSDPFGSATSQLCGLAAIEFLAGYKGLQA